MRTEIIVTVKDPKGTITIDVEIPVNINTQRAARDICEVLNYYRGGEPILPKCVYHLKNERTGAVLDPGKSVLENGVWTGDILVFMEG